MCRYLFTLVRMFCACLSLSKELGKLAGNLCTLRPLRAGTAAEDIFSSHHKELKGNNDLLSVSLVSTASEGKPS